MKNESPLTYYVVVFVASVVAIRGSAGHGSFISSGVIVRIFAILVLIWAIYKLRRPKV